MKTVRIQDRPAQVYRGDLCVVGSGAGGIGAMLPKGLHNVVVAGRCIDAEPAALASLRVMGPCFAMGRAAATAATAAHLNSSGSLHQIDIAALQDAVSDNLTRETTDDWAAEIVSETGPEAEGEGRIRERRTAANARSR